MKIVLFLVVWQLYSFVTFAQKEKIKYDIEFNAGLGKTIAKSSKFDDNQYINIGYYRQLGKSLNLVINAQNIKYNNAILGLEMGIDEFNYGYGASIKKTTQLIGGIAGSPVPNDRVILYKIAPVFGYEFKLSKRFQLRITLHPTIAFYPHSELLDDTSVINEMNWHYGVRNGDIIIQTFPPIQNNGLHFLVKAKAGLSYKFSKRVAGLFSCEYQQGFSNFVTDYTHIYVQGYPQYDDKMYYTKVKGTAYQFHFGLRFYF